VSPTALQTPVLPPQQRPVFDAVFCGLPAASLVAPSELHHEAERLLRAVFGPEVGSLRLSAAVLRDAQRCPASSLPTPFSWSAASATRRLGVGALSGMARRRADAQESARQAVADEVDAHTRLGAWLQGLGPAALASVEAHAASFAARAWVAVPWTALGASPRAVWFKNQPLRVRPVPSLDGVVLEGRADATVRTGGPGTTDRVVLRLSAPDPRAQRLDALVSALSGCPPLRCVSVDPASGEISVLDVDAEVLGQAIGEVRAGLEVMGAAGRTQERAGPHCRWCARRRQCASATTAWRLVPFPVPGGAAGVAAGSTSAVRPPGTSPR
jgi:hypothetical protein